MAEKTGKGHAVQTAWSVRHALSGVMKKSCVAVKGVSIGDKNVNIRDFLLAETWN